MARVYSGLKFLLYPDRLAAIREGRACAPVHVRIKPTNRCNHNCWYCAYRADNLQLGEGMDEADQIPPEKLFEIARDLVDMGVKAVTFSGGGEPLLYKSLPQVVEYLSANGIQVGALTNGSNLKGKMADAFARHGTWIRVSLDAHDDASYAESRSVGMGKFSQLLRNIRQFADRRSNCVLGASFIITESNAPHIYSVCRMLKDAGVSHVKLSAVVVGNEDLGNSVYHTSIRSLAALQIERAKELNDDQFHIVDHYHELAERFQKSYESCPFSRLLTVIGADGGVYTCQDKAYTEGGKLGSVLNQDFKSLWLSEETCERMQAVSPARDCQHHCVAHAKNLALLDMLSLDPAHIPFV